MRRLGTISLEAVLRRAFHIKRHKVKGYKLETFKVKRSARERSSLEWETKPRYLFRAVNVHSCVKQLSL